MTRMKRNDRFIDPVCGMTVDPDNAAGRSFYQGVDVYFCARGCKQQFDAAPQDFPLKKRKGFWGRYLDRLNKATGGRPPSCCS